MKGNSTDLNLDNPDVKEMEFQWLTKPLADVLTGEGVFIISLVIALIFACIYYFNKSRQLLNSLPGLFTSLGLLGTFVAICNSLGNINEDTLEIDVIIRNLVPAFTSSIAGLISAFFATAACKIWYSFEDKRIDKKVEMKTPEECLYDISVQSEKNNQQLYCISQQLVEQGENNKSYNDRLNATISQQSAILEKFINDFVKRMDDIFTKMHGQIEQNIKDFGEEQFKKCADTLEVLTQKLSTLSTGLLNEQKINVQQMITGTNNELRTVSANVTQNMNTLCTQISDVLQSLQNSQNERLTALISNYDNLSTKLTSQNTDFAEKLTLQLNEEYAKIQKHNTDSLQQMVDLRESYKEVNEKMLSNTTEMNKTLTSELRTSLTDFITNLQSSVVTEVEALNKSISDNVKELQKSYSYISEHVANIKGNYESASQSFQDAVNNAHRMNESHENTLLVIDNSMKHVLATNQKLNEVVDIIEERQERIENLISHINEISSTIEVLQKIESQLNKILNK